MRRHQNTISRRQEDVRSGSRGTSALSIYLPASSPSLNGAGVLWVIPSPTSLKDPSGRRNKLELGGPTRTGQFPGTAPQPTLGTSEFRD